jgi:DNA polymerase/3'-5' exonuclease PolX
MSDKQRRPADIARQIANELLAELQPYCEQICIAGSPRRRKAEVGGVVLAIEPMTTAQLPGTNDSAHCGCWTIS